MLVSCCYLLLQFYQYQSREHIVPVCCSLLPLYSEVGSSFSNLTEIYIYILLCNLTFKLDHQSIWIMDIRNDIVCYDGEPVKM